MHRALRKALILTGLTLLIAGASYGQSLGDVAREQREKQKAKETKAPAKVITNEDLPEHSDSSAADSGDDKPESSPSRPLGSKPAEQWKAEIQAQKQAVGDLQSRIDKLSSSIHFVEANRYRDGAQYNQRQEQKQELVQRMQDQLASQKKKLEGMQEAARKEGFGNAVYEP